MAKILGVRIDSLTRDAVVKAIASSILNGSKLRVATINNEFLVEAQKNNDFLRNLNDFDINIADSTGVRWAKKYITGKEIQRIPGVDLALTICEKAPSFGGKIFLLGGASGVGKKAKTEILRKFPKTQICGVIDGISIENHEKTPEINKLINESGANIVFVCLGAPKQEFWIETNCNLNNANVYIGLGGTLDYISKTVTRAPLWMRNIGLEWLYRLFKEPKRFSRIIKATVIFPYMVIKQKVFLTKSKK